MDIELIVIILLMTTAVFSSSKENGQSDLLLSTITLSLRRYTKESIKNTRT